MIWIIALLVNVAYADPTLRWMNAIEIVERHEFYQNHELIKKPKNSWQTLFGVVYRDSSLKILKDCLYYRVPGDEPGILKIKSVRREEKCETQLFAPGDLQWKELKAFQFAIYPDRISAQLTLPRFKHEKWQIPLFNLFEKPKPEKLLSSAAYRSSKMIFLSPKNDAREPSIPMRSVLSKDDVCHAIAEDCRELAASTCDRCPEGWYEIPNGCDQGPKYCGRLECGAKNQPACRRGTRWQRKESSYDCRTDNSFAFCAKGLQIQCNGNLPYCI